MSNSDDNDHYHGAILEDIDDKLAAILEGQSALADVPIRLDKIEERLGHVEDDVSAVKAAIKDQGHEIKDTNSRVKRLEAATV